MSLHLRSETRLTLEAAAGWARAACLASFGSSEQGAPPFVLFLFARQVSSLARTGEKYLYTDIALPFARQIYPYFRLPAIYTLNTCAMCIER